MENIPNSKYVSLESLKDGSTSLNQFTAVWFHYEQTNTLPAIAANKNVRMPLRIIIPVVVMYSCREPLAFTQEAWVSRLPLIYRIILSAVSVMRTSECSR